MTDFSREVQLIDRISSVASKLHAAQAVMRPVLGLAAMFGVTGEGPLNGLSAVRDASEGSLYIALAIWAARYGNHAGSSQRDAHVRRVALRFPIIGDLNGWGTRFVFRNVCGIPVACEPYEGSASFYSPANAETIFAALAERGSRWLVKADDLEPDDAEVSPVLCDQTREIIERTRPHTTCRAWVLWGPPRGGKSIAARQIAHELAGGWVRICGHAAQTQDAWDTAKALGAKAIILDDLDCNAGYETALLGLIERASAHCRVIISTANILPGSEAIQDGSATGSAERKKHELRGAILAPGRAADEEPRHYAALDSHIRDMLAPSIPEAFRHPDLLAAYLVELEKRKIAHGKVTQADVDEMLRRMQAVGER